MDIRESEKRSRSGVLFYERPVSVGENLVRLTALSRVDENVPFDSVMVRVLASKPSGIFRGGHYRDVPNISL